MRWPQKWKHRSESKWEWSKRRASRRIKNRRIDENSDWFGQHLSKQLLRLKFSSFQVNFKHYYIHFEPTDDPSSLIGSHWYTNRTIYCFRSHFSQSMRKLFGNTTIYQLFKENNQFEGKRKTTFATFFKSAQKTPVYEQLNFPFQNESNKYLCGLRKPNLQKLTCHIESSFCSVLNLPREYGCNLACQNPTV